MSFNITREYFEDLLVRIAHHSTAIEGNTITLSETISIILHNTIPGILNKREFYEVENHKEALEYIFTQLENKEELTLSVVKEVNKILLDHLDFNRGNFKTHSNAIVGSDFETASPEMTPTLMYQWVNNLNYLLENSISEEETIKIILEKHIEFERIHPFNDGNGRTGRLLIIYSLLQRNLPPLIISKDIKGLYFQSLSERDIEKFYILVKPILEKEKNRIEQFKNKEISQIF